ncbi:MAG: phage gp6-like head-tail connector protein [Proteobacteria bacterium]|nr:phage gp6-like head-tail connector protein [Pseudomonadota bacterium]
MLKVVEKSQTLPLTLEEVKIHLRLETPEEDQYLLHLIETATEYIEEYLNRSLIIQKLCYTSQGIKKQNGLFDVRLFRPNIIQVDKVTLIRANVGRFIVKRYQLIETESVPKLTLAKEESDFVEVIYDSGYGYYPKNIPSPIRHALLHLVADFYENRGEESVIRSDFFKNLLHPYRVLEI